MISEAVGYLKESEDASRTVIIGGILTLFGFLIVPLFAVAGYLVRVLDRTASGDDEAPVFEDWGELIVEGAKATAIAFVYALVPMAVLFAAGLSGMVLGSTGSNALGAIGGIGVFVGMLLWLGLSLAAVYAAPAALANFAEKRTLAAGFEVETMRRVLVDKTYATGWLTALLVIIVGGVVSSLLNVIPILGFIASAFVGFYVAVTAYYVIGHTWGQIEHAPVREQPEPVGQVQI
ncbi:DUF4013 domain-containing protein [Halalkalicoccus ordinarius]|uniref:DUF4013 domain-containing protein n=1 Tax=Halalkalicoccus ordinarius TaxID=3116651 RepID=UPI00300ED727